MLFTGESELSIDAKHRLAIPAKIRAGLDPETQGEASRCARDPEELGDRYTPLIESIVRSVVHMMERSISRQECFR